MPDSMLDGVKFRGTVQVQERTVAASLVILPREGVCGYTVLCGLGGGETQEL